MRLKTRIINIIEKYNPIAKTRRKNMRKKLYNEDFSLLVPSCAGGHLYHDLGLQFRSPTINLMMFQNEFIDFVLNMEEYLSCELEFFDHEIYDFPCAKIKPKHFNEITIHFTHYNSKEEAKNKWIIRSKRINRDNIFVCLSERDGVTKEDIEKLAELKVKGIVVFTCNNYDGIPFQCFIPKYADSDEVGNVLKRHYWDDRKEYEEFFDFIRWFNEADGEPYDNKKFCK